MKALKFIVLAFFVAYFLLGVSISRDYGVAWDELCLRGLGTTVANYITGKDEALPDFMIRYHGQIFELLLNSAEKLLRLSDIRDILLMRHLMLFLLFFISVFCFYLLCKQRFKSWKIGLLGSSFLIISPRIFADSFYNFNDMPFFSLFIISMYTFNVYIEKKNISAASIHGLASALAIASRVIGIIIPFITTICFGLDLLLQRRTKRDFKKVVMGFLVYMFLTSVLTIAFWPILWENPLYHFKEAFKQLSRYPWKGSVLYLGHYISAGQLPWHYIPIWMLITTPISYSVCFLIGCYRTLRHFLKSPLKFYLTRRNDAVFIFLFFMPIVTVISFRSVLYDAWRQMYFLYPSFLMLSLAGIITLRNKIIKTVLISLIALNMLNTAAFMVKYHPYQNVYFNILAGANPAQIKNSFELDYWGLSYRKALEYILSRDNDKSIKINVANYPGEINSHILTLSNRQRLTYVETPEEARYFLSNYRCHKEEYPFENEFYSIKINGIKIMSVYKLR